jgi:hypothetical protein
MRSAGVRPVYFIAFLFINYWYIEIAVRVKDLFTPNSPATTQYALPNTHVSTTFNAHAADRPSRRDTERSRPWCRLYLLTCERAQ